MATTRTGPGNSHCLEKLRLIEEITDLHRKIALLHDLEVKAVIQGDIQSDSNLTAELERMREGRGSLMADLKAHVAQHRC